MVILYKYVDRYVLNILVSLNILYTYMEDVVCTFITFVYITHLLCVCRLLALSPDISPGAIYRASKCDKRREE